MKRTGGGKKEKAVEGEAEKAVEEEVDPQVEVESTGESLAGEDV
jgi:hypothetical protein